MPLLLQQCTPDQHKHMQQQSDALDASEIYFLVLHWLSNGPCRATAQALLQEVEQHGLLPHGYSVTGVPVRAVQG